MISTRSRERISATASRNARLSQRAQALSPSQSVKFTPTLCVASIQALEVSSRRSSLASASTRARGRRSGRRSLVRDSGRSKAAVRVSAVSAWSSGPAATTSPPLQQQGVGDPGRDLLDVVGDQDRRRRVRVRGQLARGSGPGPPGRPGRDRPPARRAAAARGRSSAPGRSAPACAPPRSGCRRCGRPGRRSAAERAARSARSWSSSSYASRHRPTTAYEAETTTSWTRSPRGIRSASAAEVRPIRGRSSNTSTVPSTSPSSPATPAVGWIWAARTCSRRRLAGPVGTDDHPAVGLVDGPGDVGDQSGSAADDGHPGEVDDGGHGRKPIVRA